MQYIFILEFCVFLPPGMHNFSIQNFKGIYIFGHTVHGILVLLSYDIYNTWKKYTDQILLYCMIVEYIIEICYLKES